MICIFESQKVYQIEKLEALDSSNPLSKIILDDKKQNNHIIMDFLLARRTCERSIPVKQQITGL